MIRSVKTEKEKQKSREAREFEEVVNDICQGKYVLLLGSDIILDVGTNASDENKDAKGDLTRFWLNCVIQKRREMGIDYPDAKTFQEFIINNGLSSGNVRSWLYEEMDDITLERTDFNPDLIKLLKTKFFRVVFTTVFDPYIEVLMDDVWGKDKYRVMNIFDSNNDFGNDEVIGDEYYEIQPTLYYAFGRAEKNSGKTGQKFVLEDNDTLECISKWFSNSAPKRMLSYVSGEKGKALLALGCNLKDWCFRFFWYALRTNQNLSVGDIALQLETDKSEQDKNLYDYLNKTIKVRVQTNSREYIHRLVEALNTEEIAEKADKEKGGVFISYASEDFAVAWNLYTRLREAGFKVWLDHQKLSVSDDYEKRIHNAISQCKIFIPLLTPNVAAYLKADDKGENKYFRKEWKYATQECVNINICPFVTRGYDCTADYHKNDVPKEIRDVTVFDWTKKPFKDFLFGLKK